VTPAAVVDFAVHTIPERLTDNSFFTTFPHDAIDINFLYWMLKATNLRENDNATAQPVISGKKVSPTIVASPPLAEQWRIVEKVDELLGLCDELAARQAAQREKRQWLVGMTLDRLVPPETTRHPACRGGLAASAPLDANPTPAARRTKANRRRGQRVAVPVRRPGSENHPSRIRQHPTPLRHRPSITRTIIRSVAGACLMSQFALQPNRWYAWRMILGYVGERCLPYYCPIFLRQIA